MIIVFLVKNKSINISISYFFKPRKINFSFSHTESKFTLIRLFFDYLADLTKALDDVEMLIKDLLGMEKLDIAKLEEAERRFKVANNTIIGNLDVEFEKIKKSTGLQQKEIEKYELDLGPLEKEIQHVENLYKALPTQCMKPEPPPA